MSCLSLIFGSGTGNHWFITLQMVTIRSISVSATKGCSYIATPMMNVMVNKDRLQCLKHKHSPANGPKKLLETHNINAEMNKKTPSILHTHYVKYSKQTLLNYGLPECGKEQWLEYDFSSNPQFNGVSVPNIRDAKTALSIFAGVVTYEQADVFIPIRDDTVNVIVPIQVCIGGELSGVKQKEYVHTVTTVEPLHANLLLQTPPSMKYAYPPVRQSRKIPNAVLFVVPSR